MAKWTDKISLNRVVRQVDEKHDLSQHELPCPQEACNALAVECEKSANLACYGPLLRRAGSIAEVNRILEAVYADADRFRIWTAG